MTSTDMTTTEAAPKGAPLAPRKRAMLAEIGAGPDSRRVEITSLTAREALRKLVERGADGVTPLDFPHGRRVSDSMFKLRRHHGIPIRTVEEGHRTVIEGQATGSTHARYVLAAPVRIVSEGAQQ